MHGWTSSHGLLIVAALGGTSQVNYWPIMYHLQWGGSGSATENKVIKCHKEESRSRGRGPATWSFGTRPVDWRSNILLTLWSRQALFFVDLAKALGIISSEVSRGYPVSLAAKISLSKSSAPFMSVPWWQEHRARENLWRPSGCGCHMTGWCSQVCPDLLELVVVLLLDIFRYGDEDAFIQS